MTPVARKCFGEYTLSGQIASIIIYCQVKNSQKTCTHSYKEDPEDKKCGSTAIFFGSVLKELEERSGNLVRAKAIDTREGETTYNLTDRLACGLYTTPRRDKFTVNNLSLRGCELLDESFVRYDAGIETDF
jgi:hypothetical protein